ncbi:MAG: hypothetical protein Q4F72_09235, partial [Desulfovibrionaceae bacterium]|nr:hypothetical protein [Desulfovibrionaceae bacterium]
SACPAHEPGPDTDFAIGQEKGPHPPNQHRKRFFHCFLHSLNSCFSLSALPSAFFLSALRA